MVPANFVSLAEFHKRTLRPGESLSVFTHELKRLLEQALPTAYASTSKQLLLHQFINGLPNSLSTQLRAAGHINDLKTAMERAKLLMTLKEEPHKTAAVQSTEVCSSERSDLCAHRAGSSTNYQTELTARKRGML